MITSSIVIAPNQIDYVHPEPTGYPEDIARGDTRDEMMSACGAAAKDVPSRLFIPKNERAEKARYNDENGLWAMNRIDRFMNQGGGTLPSGKSVRGTHECTSFGYVYNWTACWNRHRGVIYQDGPKATSRYPESASLGSFYASCMSLYNEANPGIWGGAGVKQILNIGTRRGMLPDFIQPGGLKFKHAMPCTMGIGNSNQSHGDWVSVANMPDGWEETAAYFVPDEVFFPRDAEEGICLLLHGYAITVGRNGHCITYTMWDEARQRAPYPDSYDVIRADSFGTFRGCVGGGYTVASLRQPGDWTRPVPDHLLIAS